MYKLPSLWRESTAKSMYYLHSPSANDRRHSPILALKFRYGTFSAVDIGQWVQRRPGHHSTFYVLHSAILLWSMCPRLYISVISSVFIWDVFSPNFCRWCILGQLIRFWGQKVKGQGRSHYHGGGIQHSTLPSSPAFSSLKISTDSRRSCVPLLMQVKWIGHRFASNCEPSFEFFSARATSSTLSARIYGGLIYCVLCAGSGRSCTMLLRALCTGGCRRTWPTGSGQLAIQVSAVYWYLSVFFSQLF